MDCSRRSRRSKSVVDMARERQQIGQRTRRVNILIATSGPS